MPVKKPTKEWFVRTHPHESYRMQTLVLELKDDREMYLIEPELWGQLSAETTIGPRALFTGINRQGVLFIWPVRLPGPDGRHDEWSRSALEAANRAQESWVRVVAKMSLGAYEIFKAQAGAPRARVARPTVPGDPADRFPGSVHRFRRPPGPKASSGRGMTLSVRLNASPKSGSSTSSSRQPDGDRPDPLCLVAREVALAARLIRLWWDALSRAAAPYPIGEDALFVAYYASAEIGCHFALGWPAPARILDLYAEFRCVTSGLPVPCGNSLLGALAAYGLPAVVAAHKESMRELALRGGPYAEQERARPPELLPE